MKNPLTRTRLEFTKDRIQHYSDEARQCRDCGEVYFPKVYSQPYLVQFGAILVGLAIFVILKTQAPTWLYLAVPVPLIAFIVGYSQRDRAKVMPGKGKMKYGQIIIRCPSCGRDRAE